MTQLEFTVTNAHKYDHTTANRWIISHIKRHLLWVTLAILASVGGAVAFSQVTLLVGRAFDVMAADSTALNSLLSLALLVVVLRVFQGLISLSRHVFSETLAQLLQRNIRDELYLSLLGKSQTFHNRQRVGDIMARATSDVQQIGSMINPGFSQVFLALVYVVVALVSIASLHIYLLLTPLIFGLLFPFLLQRFSRQLGPLVEQARKQFGLVNAGVIEALNGVEVIKGFAQEQAEMQRFSANASRYHELDIKRGATQARYLPLLFLGIFYALGFAHALFLWQQGVVTVGQVVAFMGLFDLLRFPTTLSLMSFTMLQLGLAGARRVYGLITSETELDENVRGVAQPIRGAISFEGVSFAYDGQPVLSDISFQAPAGATIAIVGQTGAGKSTLTKLLNRTYDVTAGRVLIDGVDVREWNLSSLRSQISMIEQDIFLFSRSIADNIAFGAGGRASPEQIEAAARQAQAHEFISKLPDGYNTVIGQRGVTLSGGQRQRVAIARAFLTEPRILILDDSTSAIDSATEDQIQQAMRRIFQGRTTLLITHRLSQICLADWILFLHQGRLVDQGTHTDLLARNEVYRALFTQSKRNIDFSAVA